MTVYANSPGCGGSVPDTPNLVPFDIATDTIRDQVRMGGSNGDGFDGTTNKCSEDTTNFWAMKNGTAAHAATVVLRRRMFSSPAGFATRADCGDYGPGTTSAQYWEYRDVFVR